MEFKLIHEKTGDEIRLRDVVTDFRGAEWELTGTIPPPKSGMHGFVQLHKQGTKLYKEVYPTLINAKFVPR